MVRIEQEFKLNEAFIYFLIIFNVHYSYYLQLCTKIQSF